MFSNLPIRNKLLFGLALLLVIVGVLSWGGIYGLYAYRDLVKNLGRHAAEIPLGHELGFHVSNLRVSVSDTATVRDFAAYEGEESPMAETVRAAFQMHLGSLRDSATRYRTQLDDRDLAGKYSDRQLERDALDEIDVTIAKLYEADRQADWMFDARKVEELRKDIDHLQILTASRLPQFMVSNITEFTDDARTQYRTLLVLTWITTLITVLMVALFVHLSYQWIFRPLRTLVKGSRRVASGQFQYRIRLDTRDEMSELAAAMNQMTERFQSIRDDLDRQVQERTKQVVRNEQLASVGFLAAGVAHEINNPLASIAMCAESLEGRMNDALPEGAEENKVIQNYLRMIQNEAFRCKGITEKLLDFSRTGEVRRQGTELRSLVAGVIEMVGHLDKYKQKQIDLIARDDVNVFANPQEIKQVVLNLLTNALDSVDAGGVVTIELGGATGQAEMIISDNGCGMTDEVLEHLFEPFFTRRRGGQGTGLGLSIVFRIVADHEGSIEAHSDGPGRGSQFRVCLPLAESEKETSHRFQAA